MLNETEIEALAYYTQVCHGVFYMKVENRNGYREVLKFVRDMGWDVAAFNDEVKNAQANGLVIDVEYEPKHAAPVVVAPSEFAA